MPVSLPDDNDAMGRTSIELVSPSREKYSYRSLWDDAEVARDVVEAEKDEADDEEDVEVDAWFCD